MMAPGAMKHNNMGAKKVGKIMRTDLLKAGFVPHPEKCRWDPSQQVELLGMQLDLSLGIIKAFEARVKKLHVLLNRLARCSVSSARTVANLAGSLLAISVALGPVCRLRTRGMYCFIESRSCWSVGRDVSTEVKEEINFRQQTFGKLHWQEMWKSDPVKAMLSWSDASDTGWGGFILSKGVEIA